MVFSLLGFIAFRVTYSLVRFRVGRRRTVAQAAVARDRMPTPPIASRGRHRVQPGGVGSAANNSASALFMSGAKTTNPVFVASIAMMPRSPRPGRCSRRRISRHRRSAITCAGCCQRQPERLGVPPDQWRMDVDHRIHGRQLAVDLPMRHGLRRRVCRAACREAVVVEIEFLDPGQIAWEESVRRPPVWVPEITNQRVRGN